MTLSISLTRPSTVEWPVVLQDGDFTLILRRPTKGELLDAKLEWGSGRVALWFNHLEGWKDLLDASGTAIPFNEATLESVLAVPEVFDGIFGALSTLFSRSEPEKNLNGSANNSTEEAEPTTQ